HPAALLLLGALPFGARPPAGGDSRAREGALRRPRRRRGARAARGRTRGDPEARPAGVKRGRRPPVECKLPEMDLSALDRSPRASAALLLALTLLLLVPFAGKAFHIDDPLFLSTARHIVERPLDPYGFRVNWYGDEMPMWEVTKNPPLLAYLVAGAGVL